MPIVTFIGDSTLDNRIWVSGLIKNWVFTRLGLGHTTSEERIKQYKNNWLKPHLSVIENVRVQFPEHVVHDATNDGFTSRDVLQGARRDKVFGENTFSMFSSSYFAPLEDYKAQITQSNDIVLSVGGNDFREFLQYTNFLYPNGDNDWEREHYIRQKFPTVLKELTQNHMKIVHHLRNTNPNARLILMSQYYPSILQNHYKIYPFMQQIGKALNIQKSAMGITQQLIAQLYQGLLEEIKKEDDENIIFIDVTSSLNPFDNQNFTHQIEPSDQGGCKIAQMLGYVLARPDLTAKQIYRFTPDFFNKQDLENGVITEPMSASWRPLHPDVIKATWTSSVDKSKKYETEDPVNLFASILNKLELLTKDFPQFVDACQKLVTLVSKLQSEKKLSIEGANDLMIRLDNLIDDPSEYQSFFKAAKSYQKLEESKLSLYMMLIAGWAAKIVTMNYFGNAWIDSATSKLEQFAILEDMEHQNKNRFSRS